MKRFLTLLALVAISFCSYAYDFQEGGICYNITSSTEKTVSVTWNARSVLRTYSGIVVIPLDVTHNGTTYAVTSIENSAFSGSSRLTSVTIPNSVTSIGDSAFFGCSGLTSITIPNSMTSIGYGVFSGCSGLTSITIPNSVTRIGDSAFSDCSGLTSVTIPNSVTSIERYAFEGCSNMRSIHSNNPTPPTVGSDAFKGIKTMHCVIYVPIGAREDYAFANGWGDFYNIVEEDVSAIDSNTMPNAHSTDSSLYTISGTKVGVSNLPSGIYIKNGKKVLVK